MTPKEVLLGAATRIEKVGWVQGMYAQNAEGKACGASGMGWTFNGGAENIGKASTVGSLRLMAHNADRDDNKAVDAAKAALSRTVKADNLEAWNDAPGRTAADVAKAMRKAAASL